jgi:DNA-binding transcriptional LysR family regulator
MRRAEQISRRLKLRHLKVLVAVAGQKSMARAARQLAVSQPVVSKAIADLEGLVGVRLLERGARGIEPTVHGRALLKRSVAILDDLNTSIVELESLADPCAGELKIGISEAVGATFMPVVVERMSQKYPRIKFELSLADPRSLLERELRERRVDLIIARFSEESPDDVESTFLFRDPLYVVAGAANPLVRRRKLTLAELVNEPWVLPPPEHPIGGLIVSSFRRLGLPLPENRVTVPSASFTRSLVASGRFLGVLASTFVAFNRSGAPIRELPIELASELSVSVMMLRTRNLTPAARLLISCAQEVVSPLASTGARRRT